MARASRAAGYDLHFWYAPMMDALPSTPEAATRDRRGVHPVEVADSARVLGWRARLPLEGLERMVASAGFTTPGLEGAEPLPGIGSPGRTGAFPGAFRFDGGRLVFEQGVELTTGEVATIRWVRVSEETVGKGR